MHGAPSSSGPAEQCCVAVVGGGTAGLAVASELRRLGMDKVTVLEREDEAGGIPRHCGHYPFGLREYGRLLKGPDYARKNLQRALQHGVDIRLNTSVTELHPGGRLSVVSPAGAYQLQAQRVVLCTGTRESSRAQRLIAGQRPPGVISTAALQSLVYLKQLRPFANPVILGSELVSFSAISTCRHLGIQPLAMLEEQDRVATYSLLKPYLKLMAVPLIVNAAAPSIIGQHKVEAVQYTDKHGALQRIETDGVIVSGRFRPDAALLQPSHLALDPGSGGPAINQYGQCSDPAYYSCGNLLRAAETSGVCWHEGIASARQLAAELDQSEIAQQRTVNIKSCDDSIEYILPQRLSWGENSATQQMEAGKTAKPMKKMQLGLRKPAKGQLRAIVDGRCIWQAKINARPLRRIRFPLQELYRCRPQSDIELSIKSD